MYDYCNNKNNNCISPKLVKEVDRRMTKLNSKNSNLTHSTPFNSISHLDVDVENPDEKIIMTYISEFKPANEPIDEENGKNSNKSRKISRSNDLENNNPYASTSSLISSFDQHQKNQSNITKESVGLLLEKTLDHLSKVHSQKLYAPENYSLMKQLKYSVNNNLKSMIDKLSDADAKNNINFDELMILNEQFDEVVDSIEDWNKAIEDALPARVKNIIDVIKKFNDETENFQINNLDHDVPISLRSASKTSISALSANSNINSRAETPTNLTSMKNISESTSDLLNIAPLETTDIKQFEQAIKQFNTLKRTSKFNGINLPPEYWADLESQIKNMDQHLPNLRQQIMIKEKELVLNNRIIEVEKKLKYWTTPYSNLDICVELFDDYQKTALEQTRNLKIAENEFSKAVKSYLETIESTKPNPNSSSKPKLLDLPKLELNSSSISTNSNLQSHRIEASLKTQMQTVKGLSMEITSTGQLLDEIIKNFKTFNKHLNELTSASLNPQAFANNTKKSQYKQTKNELRSAFQFLSQTVNSDAVSNLQNVYDDVKNNILPGLDRCISANESKLKKDKEAAKQKRLCDTLSNWSNTVLKALDLLKNGPRTVTSGPKGKVSESLGPLPLEKLEKLSHDYDLYIKPLYIKVENKSHVQKTCDIYQNLLTEIADLEEKIKQQNFAASLSKELENIKITENTDLETLDSTLDFLKMSIIEPLENLTIRSEISTPILEKAKDLTDKIEARKSAIFEQESLKKQYEELKEELKNANSEIISAGTSSGDDAVSTFQKAFENYAKTLPSHLVATLKIENQKIIRDYQKRVQANSSKILADKLEAKINQLEKVQIPDYQEKIEKLPEKILSLKEVEKLLAAGPVLLKNDSDAINKNLSNILGLANELSATDSANNLILKSKKLASNVELQQQDAAKLRADLSHIKYKFGDIDENLDNLGEFIEEIEEKLEKFEDSGLDDNNNNFEEKEMMKDQLIIALQNIESHSQPIVTKSTEDLSELLAKFPKIKDLRFKEADLVALDFNLKDLKDQCQTALENYDKNNKNQNFANLLSKAENYLSNLSNNNNDSISDISHNITLDCNNFIDQISQLLSENQDSQIISADKITQAEKMIAFLKSKIEDLQNKFEREELCNSDLARISEIVYGFEKSLQEQEYFMDDDFVKSNVFLVRPTKIFDLAEIKTQFSDLNPQLSKISSEAEQKIENFKINYDPDILNEESDNYRPKTEEIFQQILDSHSYNFRKFELYHNECGNIVEVCRNFETICVEVERSLDVSGVYQEMLKKFDGVQNFEDFEEVKLQLERIMDQTDNDMRLGNLK